MCSYISIGQFGSQETNYNRQRQRHKSNKTVVVEKMNLRHEGRPGILITTLRSRVDYIEDHSNHTHGDTNDETPESTLWLIVTFIILNN